MLKKGFFIVFLGVDGSGKTTLTQLVGSNLRDRFAIDSVYIWFRSKLQIFLSNLLRHKKDSRNAILNLKSKKGNMYYYKIYQYLILLDYLILTTIKIRIPRYLGRNIISDRYIYDIILDLSNTFNYDRDKLEKLLNIKGFPTPDIVFMIDVPAHVAYKRKQEHPIEIIELRIKQFDLFERIMVEKIKFIRLDGTKQINSLVEEIIKHLIENGIVVLNE